MSTVTTAMADVAFETSDALGEGPAWDPRTQTLYWVDLLNKRLFQGDPTTGQFKARTLPYAASRITLCDDDRLLFSFLRRPALGTFDSERFELIELGDAVIDKQRFNDGACDSRGRLWTASYDASISTASGRMVCIDGSQVVRKADGLTLPNGIRWSPDEKTLYYVDSRPGQVWAYDFKVDAAHLGERRLLIDYEGSGVKPDGCCADVEGCLWIAEVNRGRIARYTPEGVLDRVIEVPTSKPTSVSFGGADLRTLYITSRTDGLSAEQLAAQPHAGRVFAAHTGTPGLPEHAFRTTTKEDK